MHTKPLRFLWGAALTASLLAGCGDKTAPVGGQSITTPTAQASPPALPTIEPAESPTPTPTATPAPTPIDYQTVQPYENGQVMVLMYHGIVEEREAEAHYQRTREEFRNDLQTLYDRGYRLLPLKDLLNNNITTEAGYTPVVITFDDGIYSSFSLIEENGTFVPLPDSGLAIMMEFAAEYPDFGISATFFMNGDNNPFRGAGTVSERLQYLIDNNCDIGNHTYSHADLSTLDAAQIQEEIGRVDQMIRDAVPGYTPVALTYPLGKRPDDALKPLVLDGVYDGQAYHYDFALREGQSGASSTPNHKTFDVLNLSRVRGGNGADTDLWWMLDMFEEYPARRYISDGNPHTIVVPRDYAANVNEDSLAGKELIYYDFE